MYQIYQYIYIYIYSLVLYSGCIPIYQYARDTNRYFIYYTNTFTYQIYQYSPIYHIYHYLSIHSSICAYIISSSYHGNGYFRIYQIYQYIIICTTIYTLKKLHIMAKTKYCGLVNYIQFNNIYNIYIYA